MADLEEIDFDKLARFEWFSRDGVFTINTPSYHLGAARWTHWS